MDDKVFMDMLVRGSTVIRECVTDEELLQEVKSDIVFLSQLRERVLKRKLHTQIIKLLENAVNNGVVSEEDVTRMNLDILLNS